MGKAEAYEKLRTIGQEHIFKYFDELTNSKQNELCKQIESINISTFRAQQQQLLAHKNQPINTLEPFQDFASIGNDKDFEVGKELIAAGKVGCLIVAGGQGTRLRFEGPKGMFPLSLIKKKSLFQLLAEKTAAAGKQAG